jgi:WD40 repeat protein
MVRVWDLRDGHHLITLKGPTDSVGAVAVGKINGRPVAISAAEDETVRVWDLGDGTSLATLEGRARWAGAVAVGEVDSRPVAISAEERIVRMWDLRDRSTQVIELDDPVNGVALAESGVIAVATELCVLAIRLWPSGAVDESVR